MDDNELIGGLRLLATDATPDLDVNVDAAISKARNITRRRQAIAGTALGTVALVGAFTLLTMSAGHHGHLPAAENTAVPNPGPASIPAAPSLKVVYDARSEKLTTQLADHRQQLIPAGLTVTTEPDLYRSPGGGPLPALTFITSQGGGTYSTGARLTDATGYGTVTIDVLHGVRPNLSCTGLTGPYYRTCTTRQFPDGTVAMVTSGMPGLGWPNTGTTNNLEAVRPDGTYIRILCSDMPWDAGNSQGKAQPTRPQPPLSTDDLLKFATVFSY